MTNTDNFDYDSFLRNVMNIPPRDMPSWIQCRSLEEAKALAAWCIENDIEEPRVVVLED
jgi:hypothetical protein